jgi:hypothetical protein
MNNGLQCIVSELLLKVSTWSIHAGDRLLEPDFFHHVRLGLFVTISYETYFKNSYNMSICKGAPPHFLAVRINERVCETMD